MNIEPKVGERAALVGRTGSGKTTTAIELLAAALHGYPVVIVDTKGVRAFEQLPGVIYSDPDELLQSLDELRSFPRESRFARIYRPEREDNEPRALDYFLDEVYELKLSLFVYIDEVYQVVESNTKTSRGLANLIMRGRFREVYGNPEPVEVAVICGTQRPAWVPKIIFTESDHYYVHALQLESDLKLMSGYVGEEIVIDPPGLPEYDRHDFYYYSVTSQELRRCYVNLNERSPVAA